MPLKVAGKELRVSMSEVEKQARFAVTISNDDLSEALRMDIKILVLDTLGRQKAFRDESQS